MDHHQSILQLLTEGQPGKVMCTAYDAAWVARLGEIDSEMSNQALNWICANQLPDGSWGAKNPYYYHDRVISTLAAMTALCRRGRRSSDRHQIETGLEALENMTGGATMGLMADPTGATVGFEMIAPTLVAEAESLGIIKRQGDRILEGLKNQRVAKLACLKGKKISRYLSTAFSTEMVGADHLDLLDFEYLREENGSVAYSPSATAFFAGQVSPGDRKALAYLRSNFDHHFGISGISPFDIYERAWVLWNLSLIDPFDAELLALCRPHLEHLQAAWRPGRGVGFATGYSVEDGDDTALVFAVLHQFGFTPDLDAILGYKVNGHFRCYPLEVNPSNSANVHMLEVFRRLGYPRDHEEVQRILRFLRQSQTDGQYWLDKWHTSPYYMAAHITVAAHNYDPEMVQKVIEWILANQNLNGSWGFYSATAEETAYALQALSIWARNGGKVPRDAMHRGAVWLEDHMNPPYPALWISKSLYYSEWVVRAEILSALVLASQYEG